MKKKACFIINPVAGGKSKIHLPDLINKYVDKTVLDTEVLFSEALGHAYELSVQAVEGGADIVVAVGGDGTVNEVARGVLGTGAFLGILPFGSGNGLSRFLGIPMAAEKAIRVINRGRTDLIDTGIINERPFFNVAGLGFDAQISWAFANNRTRGFRQYVKIVMNEFYHYKPAGYRLRVDNKVYERVAVTICFANSSQYGNNAHVAPLADIKDGLLDVCVIKPFPWYQFPFLAGRMFLRSFDRSPYVEIIRGKEISVTRGDEGAIHLDGEPHRMGREIHVQIKPASLNVIVP